MTERARAQAVESTMRAGFTRLVGGLSVHDLAVPFKDERGAKYEASFPIKNYELYSIVPGADIAEAVTSTSEPIGEDSVTLNSDGKAVLIESTLPLDANYGIALAYRAVQNLSARVICYSGAGIFSHSGAIFISQLQGRRSKNQSDVYREALHAGLRWTDTLVAAWTIVAHKIGATGVQIVPSQDIDWMKDTDPELNKKIAAKYDETAIRLGFDKDETGAWARMF